MRKSSRREDCVFVRNRFQKANLSHLVDLHDGLKIFDLTNEQIRMPGVFFFLPSLFTYPSFTVRGQNSYLALAACLGDALLAALAGCFLRGSGRSQDLCQLPQPQGLYVILLSSDKHYVLGACLYHLPCLIITSPNFSSNQQFSEVFHLSLSTAFQDNASCIPFICILPSGAAMCLLLSVPAFLLVSRFPSFFYILSFFFV